MPIAFCYPFGNLGCGTFVTAFRADTRWTWQINYFPLTVDYFFWRFSTFRTNNNYRRIQCTHFSFRSFSTKKNKIFDFHFTCNFAHKLFCWHYRCTKSLTAHYWLLECLEIPIQMSNHSFFNSFLRWFIVPETLSEIFHFHNFSEQCILKYGGINLFNWNHWNQMNARNANCSCPSIVRVSIDIDIDDGGGGKWVYCSNSIGYGLLWILVTCEPCSTYGVYIDQLVQPSRHNSVT